MDFAYFHGSLPPVFSLKEGVECVEFYSIFISQEDGHRVVGLLMERRASVSSLRLAACSGPGVVTILSNLGLTGIRSLELEYCHFSPKKARAVVNLFSTLTAFKVSDNGWKCNGCIDIIMGRLSHPHTLKALDLDIYTGEPYAGNFVGLEQLTKLSIGCDMVLLDRMAPHLSNLVFLDLETLRAPELELSRFFETYPKSNKLKELEWRGHSSGLDVFLANHTIEKVSCSYTPAEALAPLYRFVPGHLAIFDQEEQLSIWSVKGGPIAEVFETDCCAPPGWSTLNFPHVKEYRILMDDDESERLNGELTMYRVPYPVPSSFSLVTLAVFPTPSHPLFSCNPRGVPYPVPLRVLTLTVGLESLRESRCWGIISHTLTI
jgi:hypothetical protein